MATRAHRFVILTLTLAVASGCSDSSNRDSTPTRADAVRVSVASDGTAANGASSGPVSVDIDGGLVVYTSAATNLVAGDTNGATDIFVHDTGFSTTTRISTDSSATEANGASDRAEIAVLGDHVAFRSAATNLVAGDTNAVADIFVKEISTGTTTRISVDTAEVEADAASEWASISRDGRYVVFSSDATNLVGADANGVRDIFLRDTTAGTTVRISVDSIGTEANGASDRPVVSDDGTVVAFVSDATNLVAGDTNGVSDVFVHVIATGQTTRVSVDTAGTESDAASGTPVISQSGRYVVFQSAATNLITNDLNASSDVFLRDRVASTTTMVNGGIQANGDSVDPSLDSAGRFIVYSSSGTNLYSEDNNAVPDIFRLDSIFGVLAIVTLDTSDASTDAASSSPAISGDGDLIAFVSVATDLIDSDTNGVADIFVIELR